MLVLILYSPLINSLATFKREYRKIQSSLNNDVSNIIISAYRAFKKSFPSDAFAVTGLQPIQVARCLNDKHTHRNFDDLEFTSRTSKSNRLHTSALLTSNKILAKKY